MEGEAFEPKKQGERFALAKEQFFFWHGNRPLFVEVRKNVHKGSKAEMQSISAFFPKLVVHLSFFQTEKNLVRPPSLIQFPRESNQGRRSLPHIFLVCESLKRKMWLQATNRGQWREESTAGVKE